MDGAGVVGTAIARSADNEGKKPARPVFRFTGHRSTRLGSSQAFTLVELLVVISIIAILASFLMPAMGKAMATARSASCMNNMKQFNVAYLQYAGMFNESAPPSYSYTDSTQWFSFLPVAMPGGSLQYYQYENHVSGTLSKSLGFWKCPENQVQARIIGMGANENQCSYTANTWATTYNNGDEGRAFGAKLTNFRWPSQLVVFMEGSYPRFAIDGGTPNDGGGTIPAYPIGLHNIRYAHNAGVNVTFSDGHSGRLPAPQCPWPRITSQSSFTAAGWTGGQRWFHR